MKNIMQLQGLTKHYGSFTLDSVDINLPFGCIMGFIGANGAGKTTTIKLILDLIHPDAGSINILGKDCPRELPPIKQDIGVVFDESNFPENMNAKDINVVMKSIYQHWDANVYFSYLDQFALLSKKVIKEYSRGMKMKLSIAVALSHQARLLILDEATNGLDPIARDQILDVLLDFIQDETRAVFMSSHILSDLQKACDYITFIHLGRIIFCETKDELLENYGILKCSRGEFAKINPEVITGFRENSYGVEALVRRDKLKGDHIIDPATIEEIMLYYIKEKCE